MVFIVKNKRQEHEINYERYDDIEQRFYEIEQKINANMVLMKKQTDALTAITYLLYKKQKAKKAKKRMGSAEIQKRIFGIIEQGPIDTTKLAYELKKGGICTKNTMYRQLKQLAALGSVTKKREKRKVVYTTKQKFTQENYGDVLI